MANARAQPRRRSGLASEHGESKPAWKGSEVDAKRCAAAGASGVTTRAPPRYLNLSIGAEMELSRRAYSISVALLGLTLKRLSPSLFKTFDNIPRPRADTSRLRRVGSPSVKLRYLTANAVGLISGPETADQRAVETTSDLVIRAETIK